MLIGDFLSQHFHRSPRSKKNSISIFNQLHSLLGNSPLGLDILIKLLFMRYFPVLEVLITFSPTVNTSQQPFTFQLNQVPPNRHVGDLHTLYNFSNRHCPSSIHQLNYFALSLNFTHTLASLHISFVYYNSFFCFFPYYLFVLNKIEGLRYGMGHKKAPCNDVQDALPS